MRIDEKRYQGRKLESLAKKYSNLVMNFIKKSENVKTLESGGTIHDYIELQPLGLEQQNIHGIELEIDASLEDPGISAAGGFQMIPGEPESSYIRVTMSLPKPYNRRYLSKLYDELLEILRHEIEHAQQEPERIDAIADFSDDPFSSKQAMINYFGSPEEVAGWVTGWMQRAKSKRQPLQKVIKKQLGFIKSQAEYEGMTKKDVDAASEELLRRFVRYSLERYPKQLK